MSNNREHEHVHYRTISTLGLLRKYIISKLPKKRSSVIGFDNGPIVLPGPSSEVSHIAIILDDRVEDVIRAQHRLAALLLSEPIFVEYDPKIQGIHIGQTKYINGEFTTHAHVESSEVDDNV